MFRHARLGFACLASVVAIACGGSTSTVPDNGSSSTNTGGESNGTTNAHAAQTLNYVSPCEPTACPGSPAGDSSGVATCTSASGDASSCGWSPGAPGSTGGSSGSGGGVTGGGGVTSWSPCNPDQCGAIPAIACAAGYQESQECGSLNGAACAWDITCSPENTGKACTPSQCGAEPAIAILCDGGAASTTDCELNTAGQCEWVFVCL